MGLALEDRAQKVVLRKRAEFWKVDSPSATDGTVELVQFRQRWSKDVWHSIRFH
jgi:hypothetical protein